MKRESVLEKEANEISVILFTGHMIDKDNQSKPRFPKEKEEKIKSKIKKRVVEIIEQTILILKCVG